MTTRGDFETRSDVDIDKGLWRYTHGADAAVLCFAYSLDDGEPVLWKPGMPAPQDLFDRIENGDMFSGWNVLFEWFVWNHICVPKYGWPALPIEQCVDTMAWAAAMNLPQSLAGCGAALGLPQDLQKNKRGKYLIQRLCVPHKPTQTRDSVWVNDPALLQELGEYCVQDVRSEAEIARRLRPLPVSEQDVWVATQRINIRGLPVAVDEIRATVSVIEQEKQRLNRELKVVTDYAVTAATQREQLQTWVNARIDPPLEDLTGETVEAALQRADLSALVRRALQIRSHVCQTSTAKHETLLDIVCDDGTVKGLLTYHGASTGRWASRGGLNAQNLPRPPLKDKDIATAHEVLATGDHELAYMLFGDQVMDAAVSTVRGVIKAPPGYEFIDADWSSVENRIGSWIADQQDKVDMFAKGLDEYKVFASQSLYGVPYEAVTKDQRQVSKSAVLGCMFGQGAKGLVEYAKGYGVELTEERSQEIVDAYRGEYGRVRSLWYGCGDAILDAVRNPGVQVTAGPYLKFSVLKNFLWMKLPSNRVICWFAPQVEMLDTPWGEQRPGVTVMGVDRFTRKWSRQKLIGSSVYQSAVQGSARDLMADALLRLEAAGYPVVLLVHDEFLSLVPEGHGNEQEFRDILCQGPEWAKGLPLAAESWRGVRFKK
jgi:DNA polymerase